MRPILSIIIVNYNTKKLIKNCLSSIIKNDKRLDFSGKLIDPKEEELVPTEIIVIDNGSSDGSVKYVKSQKSKIKKLEIISNNNNLGFAKANNQGIKVAKGEYLLLLNSDTIVPEAAISQTLFWLASHPEAAVVGCKLLNQDKSDQGSYGSFPDLWTVFLMLFLEKFFGSSRVRTSGNRIRQVDWLVGAFLMVRKYAFDQAGLLDEKIFMYMEEVEWFYRLKKNGLKSFFYPNAKIIHLGGGSSVSGRTDPVLNIYRGLIYFYQKHKTSFELVILKFMLKIKAATSFILGKLTNNNYLTVTYGKAIKLV